MNAKIKGVAVKDVEADEIWGFVEMKNRHKLHKGITDPHRWRCLYVRRHRAQHKTHSGVASWRARHGQTTEAFTEKLTKLRNGHFQLTTDGLRPYENAISYSLGTRVDYAQLIKVYGKLDVKASRSIRHLRWWKQ